MRVLGRLTSVFYPGFPAETAWFGYDDSTGGNAGTGRLTAAQNDGADIAYRYDARGNIVADARVIGGIAYATHYTRDAAGRLTAITYPSGRTVAYQRDAAGDIQSVTTWMPGETAVAVASGIVHEADGALQQLLHGNGLAQLRHYDADGQLTQISVGSLFSRLYQRDAAGRIVAIDDTTPARSESYAYDAADRLTTADGPYGLYAYTWDGMGNRLTENADGQSAQYFHAAQANRLYQVAGDTPLSLDYDAAGNTITRGARAFTYNAANRLQSVTLPGLQGPETTTYAYTALGERVSKSGPAGTTHFHYDIAGRLLAETDAQGAPVREYLWLGDMPLAFIATRHNGTAAEIFHVHADHLDTALLITDAAQQVVWNWTRAPFGTLVAGNDQVHWPLRFPGQYADEESGVYYNYFRDYDPQTGRYIESDPIGLDGGINTYAYVMGNPISFTDPLGLRVCTCRCEEKGGVREGPVGSNGQKQKICTYNCKCGKSYFSTKYPSGFDESALCIQQWEAPAGMQGGYGFGYFSFETDPSTFSGWWDRFNPLNEIPAGFIDQVSNHPEARL